MELYKVRFEWGKLLKYDVKDKLAGNGQMDRIFVYEKILSPGALSAPAHGLYTCTCI